MSNIIIFIFGYMSRICKLTRKKAIMGYTVSHSNNKTKRKFDINLLKKRFYLSQNNKWITLKVSAAGFKIINNIGIQKALQKITNGKKRKNK